MASLVLLLHNKFPVRRARCIKIRRPPCTSTASACDVTGNCGCYHCCRATAFTRQALRRCFDQPSSLAAQASNTQALHLNQRYSTVNGHSRALGARARTPTRGSRLDALQRCLGARCASRYRPKTQVTSSSRFERVLRRACGCQHWTAQTQYSQDGAHRAHPGRQGGGRGRPSSTRLTWTLASPECNTAQGEGLVMSICFHKAPTAHHSFIRRCRARTNREKRATMTVSVDQLSARSYNTQRQGRPIT